MKKLLITLLVAGLYMSCMKKKEESSTEMENLKEDTKEMKRDYSESKNEPKDSILNNVKEQVKSKDGFEGKKSQY